MSGRRRERVGDLLRDEISEIVQRELSDPRLGFISITHVELSPDLHYARVFASVYGSDDEQAQALIALNNASGYIRRLLTPRLRMRVIPQLTFRLDHSMEHAEEIARILRQIEPELSAPAADPTPPTASDDRTVP
jgi:ribosome-binding factor A